MDRESAAAGMVVVGSKSGACIGAHARTVLSSARLTNARR